MLQKNSLNQNKIQSPYNKEYLQPHPDPFSSVADP
jgi:hypothetical protein